MSFKITIQETYEYEHKAHRVHTQLGVEKDGTPKFGWTEPTTIIQEAHRTTLEQTVDELDLPAIIKAINRM